jgi:hypothetical protein
MPEKELSFVDSIEILKKHHGSYLSQLSEARATVEKITGAVVALDNLIRHHETANKDNTEDKNATHRREEGQDEGGDSSEHKDGESCGQEPEGSGCDSAE